MATWKRGTFGVFVGNLPDHSNEVTVGQLFRSFGEITSIRVMDSKRENVKIAFVNFVNSADANRAIGERNGYVYCGHTLNVSVASGSKNRERKSHSQQQCAFRKAISPTAPQDMEEEIVLTQVESPVAFFAHLLRDRMEHQKMLHTLAELCPLQSPITYKPLLNKVYGAKFSEDGQWYRCQVLSNDFYDKSYVHYVDYGNKELMPHSRMVDLPQSLAASPPLALHCRLRDLMPVDPSRNPSSHREGMAFLQTQLQERIVMAKLHQRSDGTFDIARLVLGDVDLYQQLLSLGFAFRAYSESIGMFPMQVTKPTLERVIGPSNDSSLCARLEQLELQLSQERGKVKAVTAEVQRLSKEKENPRASLEEVPEIPSQMENLLQDLERVLLLRQQVPVDPRLPDYLEEAMHINPSDCEKAHIERVVDGLRRVYSKLLETKSLNREAFPIDELAAYYRRLKERRKAECPSLAIDTDEARSSLSDVAVSLAQALSSGHLVPCPIWRLCTNLRNCLSRELVALSLANSDVTVLSLMAAILESALARKLVEEAECQVKEDETSVAEILPQTEDRSEAVLQEDTDEEADDLSSLRQKICFLPIAAT